MGITRLMEDEAADREFTDKLVEATDASRREDEYSIRLLTTLHEGSSGTVAMSPESYNSLSDEERLLISEIIAANANADELTEILDSVSRPIRRLGRGRK